MEFCVRASEKERGKPLSVTTYGEYFAEKFVECPHCKKVVKKTKEGFMRSHGIIVSCLPQKR
jgi:uncharacterized C2H2 Zn-finger protein